MMISYKYWTKQNATLARKLFFKIANNLYSISKQTLFSVNNSRPSMWRSENLALVYLTHYEYFQQVELRNPNPMITNKLLEFFFAASLSQH